MGEKKGSAVMNTIVEGQREWRNEKIRELLDELDSLRTSAQRDSANWLMKTKFLLALTAGTLPREMPESIYHEGHELTRRE